MKVPLIFSANNGFVPYLSVLLESIMDRANAADQYEIILLHSGVDKDNQSIIRTQLKKKENFSFRSINVSNEVATQTFYTKNRIFFTQEAYYRLLAPYLLPEYEKAIYLDGDMIALVDVAQLMMIDLKDHLVAAVRDFCGISDAYDPKSDRRKHMEKTLCLRNFEEYFISGLMVMNLERFRRDFSQNQILQMATSREWRYHDQDLLNQLCEGNTLLLDARWNVLQDYGAHRFMPDRLYKEWKDSSKDPWIIHYGGDAKPWRYPRVKKAKYFWRYARKSPYYRKIKMIRKEEWRNNPIYRTKYMVQFLFPMGSQVRIWVKKWTVSIWTRIKKEEC